MDKIGVVLAVVLPLCGVILSIALKMISNKKREVLPCCKEKFNGIEADIKTMKKSDTDRQNIVSAVQAAIELLKETVKEHKNDYKELNASINRTLTGLAVVSENIKYMTETVEEIKKNGKKKE